MAFTSRTDTPEGGMQIRLIDRTKGYTSFQEADAQAASKSNP